MEIWKDIEGYENLYQVSNMGRIRSVKTGRIRKSVTYSSGYQYVNLSKNNSTKIYLIHRLVAKAFLPNPDNLPQVNHKNEQKDCNMVTNLEWCSKEYNINYGTRNEKVAEVNSKPVLAIKDDKICMFFKSTWEAGKNEFQQGHICGCCLGNRKTHKGYQWKYVEDYLADWWEQEMEKGV